MMAVKRKQKAAKRRDPTMKLNNDHCLLHSKPGYEDSDTSCILRGFHPDGKPIEHPSTEEEAELIQDAVASNQNMTDVLSLSETQLQKLPSVAIKMSYSKGDFVFAEGTPGDAFYVVQSGTFQIMGSSAKVTMQVGSQKLRSGDSFGELALLYDSPRATSVKC